SGEVFYKALSDADIPVYLDRSEGYFDTVEIQVFLNLLRLIDNRKQDIPLLSVLSCPIFGFTADELSEIRQIKKDVPFYDAFALFAEEGAGELKNRCIAFLDMLDEYKKEASLFPLDEFISRLILKTGYGDYVFAQNSGTQRIANLRALIDKAESFEKDNMTGLKGFISFTEMLMKRGVNVDIGQADIISESSDCVRIMTIHKSKGLEFPFVLIAGMAKEFRAGSHSGGFAFDKSGLCALKLVNPKTRAVSETAALKILKYKAYKEEYAELIRVLYVAMTRAKDILLFSACADASKKPVSCRNAKSFYEMLRPLMDDGSVYIGNKDLLSVAASDFKLKRQAFEEELASYTAEDEKTAALLCYNYFDDEASSKRKYSVSELAELEREGLEPLSVSAEDDDETPLFIANSEHELSPAERGTAYHAVMEHLDFAEGKVGPENVRECIADLNGRHLLSDAQAKAVIPAKICAFFESDIGKRAMRADRLHKESPFVMKHVYKDCTVMVQGIIDCWFEEDDGLVLVDYKSNYVNPEDKEGSYEHLREMYLPQLKLYREALEKMSGEKVKEAVLYLFSSGETLRIE
ncbi:MAG: PD-(D/E)XK nuclease family protein, partial [Firmicutes bacterium]|nr:PD-(D/E)XK nuclease family protein [Bacillota bacterium]